MKTVLQTMNRRTFLRGAAVAAASAPHFSIGRPGNSPNSKLNVAVIGVTNQGGANLRDVMGRSQCEVAAICDVDRSNLADAGRLFRAEKSEITVPDHVKRYTDYREMLHDMGDTLDAVLVCTPDHAHHHQALACMAAGKHVFVEKPLSNSIWSTRQMHAAARKYGVITQMGIHNHASEGLRYWKEWYQAGLMGAAQEVFLWTDRPWGPTSLAAYPSAEPIPEELDWDGWIGASAYRDYNQLYHPHDWRSIWDYGSGTIGDMACHIMDVPNFMLDLASKRKIQEEQRNEDNIARAAPRGSCAGSSPIRCC
jgi:predicted dehydrogenase